MTDTKRILWVAGYRIKEAGYMNVALQAGYDFDFTREFKQSSDALGSVEYGGLYLADLFFSNSRGENGLALITLANKHSVPILVRAHKAADEALFKKEGIEFVSRLKLRIGGERYLMERFGNVFGPAH